MNRHLLLVVGISEKFLPLEVFPREGVSGISACSHSPSPAIFPCLCPTPGWFWCGKDIGNSSYFTPYWGPGGVKRQRKFPSTFPRLRFPRAGEGMESREEEVAAGYNACMFPFLERFLVVFGREGCSRANPCLFPRPGFWGCCFFCLFVCLFCGFFFTQVQGAMSLTLGSFSLMLGSQHLGPLKTRHAPGSRDWMPAPGLCKSDSGERLPSVRLLVTPRCSRGWRSSFISSISCWMPLSAGIYLGTGGLISSQVPSPV